MPIAECGALLPRNAAVNINSPHRNNGSPLSASIHRTIAARVLPTPSGIANLLGRIGAGVLLRWTIVNRTYGTHKKQYIYVFFLTIFGPTYYGPP